MKQSDQELLKKQYTEEENHLVHYIRGFSGLFRRLYQSLINEDLQKISYQLKGEKDKYKRPMEFGFYINESLGYFAVIMKRLKLTSFVDLGSGPGLTLATVSLVTHIKNNVGFENEDSLVELAKKMQFNVYKEDITTLKPEDIKDYQVVYFYEPIHDDEKCKIFIDNLCDIMYKGQLCIFQCAGSSYSHMLKNPLVKNIDNCTSLRIFEKQ